MNMSETPIDTDICTTVGETVANMSDSARHNPQRSDGYGQPMVGQVYNYKVTPYVTS
jgi:hypothetical protein